MVSDKTAILAHYSKYMGVGTAGVRYWLSFINADAFPILRKHALK